MFVPAVIQDNQIKSCLLNLRKVKIWTSAVQFCPLVCQPVPKGNCYLRFNEFWVVDINVWHCYHIFYLTSVQDHNKRKSTSIIINKKITNFKSQKHTTHRLALLQIWTRRTKNDTLIIFKKPLVQNYYLMRLSLQPTRLVDPDTALHGGQFSNLNKSRCRTPLLDGK